MLPAETPSARTLLVVTAYWPSEGGGLETYVVNLTRCLRQCYGWRIVVVTSGPRRRAVRRDDQEGLVVYRLPYDIKVANTRFGLLWRRRLAATIRHERPTLINVHLPVPGLADLVPGVAGGIPIVVTYHAGSMRNGQWPSDIPVWCDEGMLGRRLLGRAAWIISSSDFVRDSHLTRFRTKCSTVTPGVDPVRFSPSYTARDQNRLLFAGGLGPAETYEGLDTLLDALVLVRQHHPAITLDVVGGGNSLEDYQRRCAELGLGSAVRFRGQLGGADRARAYQQAALLALPTRNASFPTVLLEAMATGLPVVSARVGGIPSLVQDNVDGLLIDPGDVCALADRVSAIIDDPDLARRLGSAARAKVDRSFRWEIKAAETNAIFEAVVAGRPVGGKRHVAVVTPYYPPKIGGLERYASQIASGLQATGRYEVLVLTSNHLRRRFSAEVVDGLTVLRYPPWLRASNTPMSPTWPLHLRRAIRDNRIELLHVHTPVPFMAEAAALGAGSRPLALTYHSGSMVKGRQPVDTVIRAYERLLLPKLLRRADAVVAVSEAVRSRFLARFVHTTHIAPPAVDIEVFSPFAIDSPPSRPTVLFVGRIERSSSWKGIDVLIAAFRTVVRHVPDAQLIIVGDGNAVDGHRLDAAALGIATQVTFAGILTGRALADTYRSATVVVVPSTSDAEAFGMTLIEAMACAKPVIGSNVGGIPSVIDDGKDGFLVPPGDVEALAASCIRLLRDSVLAERLGANGRRKVADRYTWSSRVEVYDALFRELLGEPDAQRAIPILKGACSWT